MSSGRAYRRRARVDRSTATRDRILQAVRALLAEGTFHESTMAQVAARAEVSRATLYQHFRSRVELVDAMCDTFAKNPALRELRETVRLDDPTAAVARTIDGSIRFWSSEDPVLRELYGVAAIDPAAQALVDRQRADRRSELERLVQNLRRAGRLAGAASQKRALNLLLVLTSYETYRELREAGLSDKQAIALLQEAATVLLTRSAV